MSEDRLREELAELLPAVGTLPLSVQWMSDAIRHCQRNMDFEFEDAGNEPDRYAGRALAHLANLLPDIIAALSVQDRDDGWQPIDESTPTNRALQVWIPTDDYYGNNGVYTAMLVDMGTGKRWMTFGWAVGRDCGADAQPVKWRPLPAAPSIPQVQP